MNSKQSVTGCYIIIIIIQFVCLSGGISFKTKLIFYTGQVNIYAAKVNIYAGKVNIYTGQVNFYTGKVNICPLPEPLLTTKTTVVPLRNGLDLAVNHTMGRKFKHSFLEPSSSSDISHPSYIYLKRVLYRICESLLAIFIKM